MRATPPSHTPESKQQLHFRHQHILESSDDVNLSPIVKSTLKRQPGRVRIAALRHAARNDGGMGQASAVGDTTARSALPQPILPRQLLDRSLPPLPTVSTTDCPPVTVKRKAVPLRARTPDQTSSINALPTRIVHGTSIDRITIPPSRAEQDATKTLQLSPRNKRSLPIPPSPDIDVHPAHNGPPSPLQRTDSASIQPGTSQAVMRVRQIAGPKVKEAVQRIEGEQMASVDPALSTPIKAIGHILARPTITSSAGLSDKTRHYMAEARLRGRPTAA